MEPLPPLLEKTNPPFLEVPGQGGRNPFIGLMVAVQFLTIAPPILRRPFTAGEMGRAVGFFPLVGLGLGALLLGLNESLLLLWSPTVSAALVLAAWVLATGALHLDGFLDSCDGLLGGRTAEDRLRILHDERVGAYAVVGGVLLLLLKFLLLSSMQNDAVAYLLAPMLGRWGMVLAIVIFPYARAEGLGRSLKDHAGWRSVILATTVTAIACGWAGQLQGLLALALTGWLVWVTSAFTLKRLPGLTGDVYGAICEMTEVLVLLIFAARFSL